MRDLIGKRYCRLLQALLGCLLWLVASGASPACAAEGRNLVVTGGKRLALVIGNAAYPGVAALRNPANDAVDIAAKLRAMDFDVTLKTDVRQKEMLRALTEFGDRIHQGAEVLFFYAGHGMQVRGRNYLIPIDASIRTESAVSSEAVDVDQLLDKLSPARLSMVILDACRNNPFERSFRGGGQGLASINAPNGTLIAYATAPGRTAADGEGRNGLYTQELLAAMGTPGLRIEDVFKRVRANVLAKSGEAQTPWESSSLTGDFYFSQPTAATLGAQPTPVTPGALTVPLPQSATPSDETSPTPEIDGIWTISSNGKRMRIENGSVHAVDSWRVLIVSVEAGQLVARDLIRIGPGSYREYDLLVDGEAKFELQADGSLSGASTSLGVIPIPWKLYPSKPKNEAAYREAVELARQRQAQANAQPAGQNGLNAGY